MSFLLFLSVFVNPPLGGSSMEFDYFMPTRYEAVCSIFLEKTTNTETALLGIVSFDNEKNPYGYMYVKNKVEKINVTEFLDSSVPYLRDENIFIFMTPEGLDIYENSGVIQYLFKVVERSFLLNRKKLDNILIIHDGSCNILKTTR